MLFEGNIFCSGCGVLLEQTKCKYCGSESDYVFMEINQYHELLRTCSRPSFMSVEKSNILPEISMIRTPTGFKKIVLKRNSK